MGKTKYMDGETIGQQGFYTANRQANSRKQGYAPGRFAQPAQDVPTLRELAQQIGLRLRRTWVSLRFQFHRATLGVFRQKTMLKLGALTLTGFWLLASDREPLTLLASPIGIFVSDKDSRSERPSAKSAEDEATLELGSGSTGFGKSVNWGANEAAPVGVAGVREAEAEDYIRRFSKIAQAEMEKFGIPASISLAQGLVESRAGNSKLARNNNNHFGMKCFSKKCAPGHCSNFSDDHHKDFFRKYKNSWESWRAHSEMLASGRYATLQKHGRDYRKWAYGLKSLGYATDRTYAEKLIGMIERYDLHRFDR